jgi:cobalt-precorrin-6B (C15)-methyltransferase
MAWDYKTPGIPEELFIRDESVPITKEEVRVIALSKARLREGYRVIDLGCGTGSISIEAALQVGRDGKVYAVDRDATAVMLTKENVKRFYLSNVEVIHSDGREFMNGIPDDSVDAIFIGGAGGEIYDMVKLSYGKLKQDRRMVIDTILIESMYSALDALKGLGTKGIDITEVIVAKGKRLSIGTMLTARNPVLIITVEK